MNRLGFKLPEFTRIVWASAAARGMWEPRIQQVSNVWQHIEKATVSAIRPGGLQSVKPEDLCDFQAYCHNAQIEFAIVQREGVSPVYGNSSVPVISGRPWQYRVYMGENPKEFLRAWTDSDQIRIGQMLGYPVCCSKFFQHYWVARGYRDLTIPMDKVDGPHTCNILLRHLGIRPVFHLPCSLNCSETSKLARSIIQYGHRLGYGVEMGWLEGMLGWPVKWSSLHGVSITETPVVKVIASSDALAEVCTYERANRTSMLDGIRDTWSDNGFASFLAMRQAHALIIQTVERIMFDPGNLLDLGCGNGILLDRLNTKFPQLTPFGVESDPERAQRATERIGSGIVQADIFKANGVLKQDYEIILLSLNRIKEVEDSEADLLLRHLRGHTKYLLIYSYEGWDETYDSLVAQHFAFVGMTQDSSSEVKICRPR